MQIGNQARQKVTPVIFAIILEDRVFQQLFCPEWAFWTFPQIKLQSVPNCW